MKTENLRRKRTHKVDEIGVGRIRTVPFSSDSAYDSVAYDIVGVGSKSRRTSQSQYTSPGSAITVCHDKQTAGMDEKVVEAVRLPCVKRQVLQNFKN